MANVPLKELSVLATLQINRLIARSHVTYKLHGFSDSLEAAYAAAVYLGVVSENQDLFVTS